MKPQRAEIREIFEDKWSQLDPDHRTIIANNRDLLDEVMGELLPGTRRPRIVRREETSE
jgi:hypothetical protein